MGAGPGAADLLTMRAAEVLARADVVVHDRLVGPDVLALAAPRALRIDVGKSPGESITQSQINDLLEELAARHDVVVRLKGGDPFVFGRGGEEALALSRRGVVVHVVPGLSSALSAPLLAGIPVTHRGVSRGVCVVTATTENGAPLDVTGLAHPNISLVILMGVAQRARIAEQLQVGGLDPTTPVAVVHAASCPGESVVRSQLRHLARLEVSAPSVIVVGPVAALQLGLPDAIKELVATT